MPDSLTLKTSEPHPERSRSPPHDSPRPTPPGSPFADGSLDRNASPTAKMARDDEHQDSRPWECVWVPKKHFAWLSKMCAGLSGVHTVGCFQGHLKQDTKEALFYYEVAIHPRYEEDILSRGSKRLDEIIINDFTVRYDHEVNVHGKATADNRAKERIKKYFEDTLTGLSSGKGVGLDLYYRREAPPKLRSRIEWMLVLRDILESKEEVFRRVTRCFLAVGLILVGDNQSPRARDLIAAGQQQWRAWFQELALTDWRWHLNHVIACLRLMLQVSGGKTDLDSWQCRFDICSLGMGLQRLGALLGIEHPGPPSTHDLNSLRQFLSTAEMPVGDARNVAVILIEGMHQQQLGYHFLYRALWLHGFLGLGFEYRRIWEAHHDGTVAASFLLGLIQVKLGQRQKTIGTTVQEKLGVLGEIEKGLLSGEFAELQPPSALLDAPAIPQDFDVESAMEDIRAFGTSKLNIPLIPDAGRGLSHSNITYCVAICASRFRLPDYIIRDPHRFIFSVWYLVAGKMQPSK